MSSARAQIPIDVLIAILLDHSSEVMLAVDPQSLQIAGFNRAAADTLGYAPDALLGMSILDIECAIQDLFFWDGIASGALEEVERVEGLHRRSDGTLLPVERTLRVVDSKGVKYLLLVARDISDRKKIEELLAEKTSQLAATLESTADGVLVVDLYGRLMNFNQRFVEIWRLPNELLLSNNGEAILEFMAGQTDSVDEYLQRLVEIGSDPVSEGFDTLNMKDGRSFERSAKPMYVAGQPVGRVFSFSDVTIRKQVERELIVARDQAEKASKAKSEFLSQMSHELRTPLNAILGFAQILETEVEPGQGEIVQHIMKAGWHLLDLINEVLDLARIEAGKFSVEVKPVALPDVLKDCVMLTSSLARQQGITLNYIAASAAYMVKADPMRLKQMVLNLVSNAIKYNRPQGTVTLEAEARDDRLRVLVRDTGIGMSAADVEQLFTPFTRVGDKQHNIEGSGIGLALTRELARMMGGDVGVSSELGVGSSFWIDLPLIEVLAPPPVKSAVEPGQEKLVLYVEDDPVSMVLMKEVFKRIPGTRLLTAVEPYAGLELALGNPLSLILLDVNLPGMSGIELLRLLRNDPRTAELTIFAFSANALQSDIEAGLAAGFNRYLTKPLQIKVLIETLSQALSEMH